MCSAESPGLHLETKRIYVLRPSQMAQCPEWREAALKREVEPGVRRAGSGVLGAASPWPVRTWWMCCLPPLCVHHLVCHRREAG